MRKALKKVFEFFYRAVGEALRRLFGGEERVPPDPDTGGDGFGESAFGDDPFGS